MKKNNKKSNKQNKRNTNQFKKSIKMKNQKMKNQSNDNYNSYQEEYNSQKPKSEIGMELSNLLGKYSKNRYEEGYSIVKSLSIEGGFISVIGYPKGELDRLKKFDINDYEDETFGIKYDLESIDVDEKEITTKMSVDYNFTTDLMKNEFEKEDIGIKYMGMFDDFSKQMGNYILNVFDDYTLKTINLINSKRGVISIGVMEPKDKIGSRYFPLN